MPTLLRARLAAAFVASAGVLLLGCSDGPKGKVAEVQGVVKLDDAPLVKVYVEFLPEDSKLPGSSAVTDEGGNYTLKTSDGRAGAVVGKHRVLIRGERGDERSGAKGSPRPVPAKYAQATADNPLGTVEVGEGKKSGYDFDLKSK